MSSPTERKEYGPLIMVPVWIGKEEGSERRDGALDGERDRMGWTCKMMIFVSGPSGPSVRMCEHSELYSSIVGYRFSLAARCCCVGCPCYLLDIHLPGHKQQFSFVRLRYCTFGGAAEKIGAFFQLPSASASRRYPFCLQHAAQVRHIVHSLLMSPESDAVHAAAAGTPRCRLVFNQHFFQHTIDD